MYYLNFNKLSFDMPNHYFEETFEFSDTNRTKVLTSGTLSTMGRLIEKLNLVMQLSTNLKTPDDFAFIIYHLLFINKRSAVHKKNFITIRSILSFAHSEVFV